MKEHLPLSVRACPAGNSKGEELLTRCIALHAVLTLNSALHPLLTLLLALRYDWQGACRVPESFRSDVGQS